MLRHRSKAIPLAMSVAALIMGPALAEPHDPESGKEIAMTRIHVIVGSETLSGTLDDTPAGRDFARLLPLELSLRDYHGTEKIADLPRALDTREASSRYTPKAGDITYYAPWGNLAIFYKAFQTSRGLVRLGAFDGPIDPLLKDGIDRVRIEKAD